MSTILYIAPTETDGTLAKAALEALTAAKNLADALGATLIAGFIGENVQPGADAIAHAGASKILAVCGADFSQARYATDAAAIEALTRATDAQIVIAPGTSRINRVLPGVGHRLGGCADLHVSEVTVDCGTAKATRWFYRQRMMGVIQRKAQPWLMAVDPGTNEAYDGGTGSATVETVSVDLPDTLKRTNGTGFKAPATDEQTIRPDAELLFVTGAGWTKTQSDGQTHTDDAAKHILDFLAKTQASLGSSKSLVDLGGEGQDVLPFLSHLNQVGQTGATPRHAKGLSTCCHGEEPHVVGWRFINERRAVNTDANCGWAQGKADVLYVTDAFELMEKVNALLSEG
jgi:electron transfer flavoprotein alpha subunit